MTELIATLVMTHITIVICHHRWFKAIDQQYGQPKSLRIKKRFVICEPQIPFEPYDTDGLFHNKETRNYKKS